MPFGLLSSTHHGKFAAPGITGGEITQSSLLSVVQRIVTTHTPRRCGHCRNLAPEWEKAAKALKGIVRVAAIDMDKYQAAGQPYGIRGFPTIKVSHRANNGR
jgi:thioredoxin-like negative regulator of GroEL